MSNTITPGLYTHLDKGGNKVLIRVFPEVGEPEVADKVFISPEVKELKPGLCAYLDKNGDKIQGRGWQLKEFSRHYKDAFKIFKSLRVIWDEINPDYKPANLSLPDRIVWANAPKSEELAHDDIPIQETSSILIVEEAVVGYKPNGKQPLIDAETNINKPKK